MSAQHIYDTAPLGSLIRFSSAEPCPPARFSRKLKDWNHANGVGRLVERTPECVRPAYRLPASFTLHLGDYGEGSVVVMVVRRGFSVESPLDFAIVETPEPGMVRLLTPIGDGEELQHLARDMAAAEAWMATHHFNDIRAEIVPDPDPVSLPVARGRAA